VHADELDRQGLAVERERGLLADVGVRERGVGGGRIRPAAMAAYNDGLQGQLESSVWKAGCRNWYMTELGRITTNWPRSTFAWRKRTRALDLGDFELVPAAS